MLLAQNAVSACKSASPSQAHVYRAALSIARPRLRSRDSIRQLSTTRNAAKGFSSGTSSSPFRVYRYVIDHHGQLFLHDTTPKNLTSCFKNTNFLDFFFTRMRPNPVSSTASAAYVDSGSISRHDILNPPRNSTLSCDWSDLAPFNGVIPANEQRSREQLEQTALEMGDRQGYEWISPCGPELNLVRTQDTPIVYTELDDDGLLKWAGTLTEPFQPEQMVVDPENGYVYHPSPKRQNRRRNKSDTSQDVKRYGELSLLGSNLVLSRLAEGLEIDAELFEKGVGGSIEWQGKRYDLGLLGKA